MLLLLDNAAFLVIVPTKATLISVCPLMNTMLLSTSPICVLQADAYNKRADARRQAWVDQEFAA
jgi:hypothetical protein